MTWIRKNANLDNVTVKENGQEAYPYVSELWYEILTQFPISQQSTMRLMRNRISNQSLMYLKHSKMLPKWKTEEGLIGSHEKVWKIISMHMVKCSKSAMILDEFSALELHTILKDHNKQSFYGKDTVFQSLRGYRYYGYFPTQILLRIRQSFKLGILEWWQKYTRWLLNLKIKRRTPQDDEVVRMLNGPVSDKSKTALYVLLLIPSTGLILSSLIFIIFDSNILRKSFLYIQKTISALLKFTRNTKTVVEYFS